MSVMKDASVFLLRLGQESKEWKEETVRRVDEKGTGKKTSLSDLRDQINRG